MSQPIQPAAPSINPNQTVRQPRPNAPARTEVLVRAIDKEAAGGIYKLRGAAEIETTESLLKADEIDYNEETEEAEARGNVYFKNFSSGEELRADRVEYNLHEETGKFYNVRGSSPAKIEARPGVLTSSNPFIFEGQWAERIKDRYILHDGFITSCKLPRPTWVVRGSRFDVIPGRRAIGYHAMFRLRRIPVFYTPIFYKALDRNPRKSGFLMPNIGNSSRRGRMLGGGYYWAINRSYDLMYRAQWFTLRGIAHTVDLRGKPREGSDFNMYLYGVNDKGLLLDDGTRRKEGGFILNFQGRSELGKGFYARGIVNYLSSFTFRQAFTESFNEAIFTEVNSIGFVARQWSTYSFHAVFSRQQNFQGFALEEYTLPGEEFSRYRFREEQIVIRHLPQFEFRSRDHRLTERLPVWFSFNTTAGFVRRNQNLFQTRQMVERLDGEPRLTTALRWKDIHLIPSFGFRGTYYGSSRTEAGIAGRNYTRYARDLNVDLVLPSLARVFDAPSWLGKKVKHVIEPRARYRDVSGVADFDRLIRFDEMELLTNTREVEYSLTNRLLAKGADDSVREVITWELIQRRYFDPDFGGAVVEGRRNVVLSSSEITGYAFLDRPRGYSPIVSIFRTQLVQPLGIEWRADYDTLRRRFVNSGITADARRGDYFISIGHSQVRSVPLLSPSFNQFRGSFGFGNEQRRGWNAAFLAFYDFREGVMQFASTQVTYNNNCCGISFQYRRFSFGQRNENQFRVALAIANIGSFGTLRKQDRIF